MTISLHELAQRLQAEAAWLGSSKRDGELPKGTGTPASVSHLSRPCDATMSSLSFLFGPNPKSASAAHAREAGAVLVDSVNAHQVERPFVVDDPLLALARANHWLPVVRSTAIRGLAENDFSQSRTDSFLSSQENLNAANDIAQVHESAVIGSNTVLGRGSYIGANATLGDDVSVGGFCTIGENVTINGPVKIGNRVHIDANCTIGSEPFFYVQDGGQWLKVPGFCGVVVNDDVDIGAGSTIDKGLVEHTVIGRGVKLDSQIHIGHGVCIGRDTVIAGRTTIAGEAVVGAGCIIGGACVVGEGVKIGENITLLGMSAVTRSLRTEGEYTSAWPVQPRREWWKQLATLKSLAKR